MPSAFVSDTLLPLFADELMTLGPKTLDELDDVNGRLSRPYILLPQEGRAIQTQQKLMMKLGRCGYA